MMLHGRRKRAFDRPATVKAHVNGVLGHPGIDCPFADCLSQSVEGKQSVIALVVGLLSSCGPSAVFGTVWSICVDTVNTVLGTGTRAHVNDKVLKAIPSLTDSDASSTVSFICMCVLVQATLSHTLPDTMFSRSRASMCNAPCANTFDIEATAGASGSANQIASRHGADLSAVASAPPERTAPLSLFGSFNNSPTSEALADERYKIVCSHCDPPSIAWLWAGAAFVAPRLLAQV